MLVPCIQLSKSKTVPCIGIANQGASGRFLDPQASWTPLRAPQAFVGAGAQILSGQLILLLHWQLDDFCLGHLFYYYEKSLSRLML